MRWLDDEISKEMHDSVKAKTEEELARTREMLQDMKVVSLRPPRQMIADLSAHWEDMPVEVRRDLLSRLIHPVMVKPGRPKSQVIVRGLWEEPPSIEDFAA